MLSDLNSKDQADEFQLNIDQNIFNLRKREIDEAQVQMAKNPS